MVLDISPSSGFQSHSVELKHGDIVYQFRHLTVFNRTIPELKSDWGYETAGENILSIAQYLN